jgi:hypothetical protein
MEALDSTFDPSRHYTNAAARHAEQMFDALGVQDAMPLHFVCQNYYQCGLAAF